MGSTDLGLALAADLLQIVVVLICAAIFLYVRAACGPRARYFVNLAFAYVGMGVVYFFNAASALYFNWSGAKPTADAEALLLVIDSSISLINSAFFLTAWYMMRDMRLESKVDVEGAFPSMSNTFASVVIGGVLTTIAAYIGMASMLIQDKLLLGLFSVIDVLLAFSVAVLIGTELVRMPLVLDSEEGSLFVSLRAHAVFRYVTFAVYVLFGTLQFSYLFSVIPDKPLPIFAYPEGQAYHWLAMLKLLCAGSACILGLHALPAYRWKHRRLQGQG